MKGDDSAYAPDDEPDDGFEERMATLEDHLDALESERKRAHARRRGARHDRREKHSLG